jgi:UDP-N-acetylmuramyl pentapeptide phosphotransferase/UDP-N-acetylglucosamine-1-phosphate transferase
VTDFAGNWQAPNTLAPALIVGTVAATFGLILCLQPLLERYAMARPNARSAHKKPTPQGAGIAVITIAILACALLSAIVPGFRSGLLVPLFVSVVCLAIIGAIDDIRPLEVLPRLTVQTVAVLIIVVTLPSQIHILAPAPFWLERAFIALAMLWFVNLVNFMDGIDWMTVVEVVPVTAALALFGLMGALPGDATLVSLALCGAMLGFAPFNRPVARLFLGDVGSLPIGLLLAWLLVLLADRHLAVALLLPFYYFADATVTLLRRFARGEPVMQAHRSHFYQRALDNGFSVYQIVGRVFLTNIALAGIAAFTLWENSLAAQATSLIAGGILVGALLWNFSSARKSKPKKH